MENNPHMLYGRSDKRGYMLLEITPKQTVTHFMGLDDVRDAKSAIAELAAFRVADGVAGAEQTS
jgi:alkaline phosphatase D